MGDQTCKWPKTPEEAWEMPLAEVMGLPLEELFEDYEPVTAEEREELFSSLGKPTGVGLQAGYAGPMGKALPDVALKKGDTCTANETNFRGVRHLRIVRLGQAPDIEWYARQVGGKLQSWDARRSENVFYLDLVWKTTSE